MYNVTKMADIAAVPQQMAHLPHPLETVSLAKKALTFIVKVNTPL